MPALATVANTAWLLGNLGSSRRFRRALETPGAVQREILARYVRENGATAFGAAHGFSAIRSAEEFQKRVPISTYEDYEPYIQRLAKGEQGVLTREPVRRFVPTSGSSSAEKWIPYTRTLLKEFSRGIAPWIANLFETHPALRHGPAYWSISPAVKRPTAGSVVPVGFDDDSAYLGGLFRRVVDATFAVPGEIRAVGEMESFRYLTLLCLLRVRELRLISVWHPSFLTLLLEATEKHWEWLVEDIARGTVSPPAEVSGEVLGAMRRGARADPVRAAELREIGPRSAGLYWPRLALVSCWADGQARGPANVLGGTFPNAALQGKGLLSTEAFVSLPYVGEEVTHYPLAIRSHFFEFLPEGESDALPLLAENLEAGGTYTVLVTTGGGLYRYNMRDRVRVTGRCLETPCIEFLGKEDLISDLCGEKLNALFVAGVLAELKQRHGLSAAFAMLAPDGASYTLFMESGRHIPAGLVDDLDEALSRNPHYAYCRRLGQLGPARVFRIRGKANEVYLEACRRAGQRLGDIKPTALHRAADWGTAFEGAYID